MKYAKRLNLSLALLAALTLIAAVLQSVFFLRRYESATTLYLPNTPC